MTTIQAFFAGVMAPYLLSAIALVVLLKYEPEETE